MSELQLSLLVIGALLVLAIYIFNRYQERKFQRRAEQAFPRGHDDVLMNEPDSKPRSELARGEPDERIEPTLDSAPLVEKASVKRQLEGKASVELETAEPPSEAPREPTPAPPREETPQMANGLNGQLDPAINYIAIIHPDRPLPGSALNGAVSRIQEIGKSTCWAGLNGATREWQEIQPAERYSEIRVGLQLLDRSGLVSERELEAFADAIEESAAEWGATVECPDVRASLASAKKLDAVCAQIDVMVGLNIVSADGAPFHGTKVRTLAESSGFKLNPNGAFEYTTEHGVPLFYLLNQEAQPFAPDEIKKLSTRGVTLLFDVPKVPEGLRAFDRMVALARRFSEILGGALVDDRGRPLNDEGIGRIRNQLREIYKAMDVYEIPPGGARAFRLFS